MTAPHFAAAHRKRPLSAYSVVEYGDEPVIELRYRDGSAQRLTFAMSNGLVLPHIVAVTLRSHRGPLPALEVDGIGARLTETAYHPTGFFGSEKPGWIHDYGVWLYRGVRDLRVAAGPYTKPETIRVRPVGPDDRLPRVVQVRLRLSARGATAARRVVEAWARKGAKAVPKTCSSFNDLAVDPRSDRMDRGALIESPDDGMRKGAWAVEVIVRARGVDTSIGIGEILVGAFFAPFALIAAAPAVAIGCAFAAAQTAGCPDVTDVVDSLFASEDPVRVTVRFVVHLDDARAPRLADPCPRVTRIPL